ncbi:WYL domain-containing protein [Shewanella sp. 10N.286.45.A1]|uniref:WYL domain-containing protein n=1 Tax=Shewanella sp. 10N.286.45.A1 TaxID=3229694 RepID=UPI00354C4AC2
MSLKDINYAQKQRLAYIDFKLLFVGSLSRIEIVNHFEKGLSSATRDINLYKELCPSNMKYDPKDKKYYQTSEFEPLFNHDPRKTLVKLANQITDGFDVVGELAFPVQAPSQLNVPNIFIVAKLVQAIINKKSVKVTYTSLSSGETTRELVPHSMVDNGLRWHIRAYDRKSKSFRDFVISRISEVTLLPVINEIKEGILEDHQWMRMVPLQLVPHPKNVKHAKAIEMDFGMLHGVLEVNVRAAMAGYLLRCWNVDCSNEAKLKGAEYQLFLQNRQTLYGADNLMIAPGYQSDEEGF